MQSFIACTCVNPLLFLRHGVKVGPGPRDPPPQSLKVGPRTPLKFKNGTPGPLYKV